MMDNDKWMWGDAEDSSPIGVPLLDAKLTPIIEWPERQPEPPSPAAPPEQSGAKPEELPAALTEANPGAAAIPAEAPAIPPVAVPPPAPAAEAPPRNRNIPPSVMRAIVLHLEGRLEEAIREIQIGLRGGEAPADLYSAMGALQLELERYEDAAASYAEVLKSDPENEPAKQHHALCVEKASEAKKPPKPSPSLVKAIALHTEGKLEEAIKELQRGMKGGEPPLDVYAALGHLQFEAGRFDAAAEAYREVLKRQPLHESCHYNLAVCLEKTGRHKEAFPSFQKALEIDSRRVEI